MTEVHGSFRDPSAFVFSRDGVIHRQIQPSYKQHYDHLMSSGLYEALVGSRLLVAHDEVDLGLAETEGAYKVIRPEQIPFVSYPYEWSFSQLQDAALATLAIQKKAFEFGMTLKDASAYNIQFLRGKPVLIDTASFETYKPGQIWVPYRQFCQHFLAPLALMSMKDVRFHRLLQVYLDGIPLDLAASLLPGRSRLSFGLLTHLHIHARVQRRYADRPVKQTKRMGETAWRGLTDSLESTVRRQSWRASGTEWVEYYEDTNYSRAGLEDKERIVAEFLAELKPETAWDLGANTGRFSRVAAGQGIRTVAFDVDPACVERNYLQCKKDGESLILPLLCDLTNPSPGIGWANSERMPFVDRGPVDVLMALALIHHLAISNNVPLVHVARLFSGLSPALIIEFVPKQDSQVQRLLATREDVFPRYTQEGFETDFRVFYDVVHSQRLEGTDRVLYCMKRKNP